MEDEKIKSLIRKHGGNIEKEEQRRLSAKIPKESYLNLLKDLKEGGITHLTAITGTDLGENFEILYHLESGEGTLLNISFEVEKEDDKIDSITDIFPGAILYEREVMEMLGIKIENHPDPRRLFLADSWPKDKHPLRKEQYNYSKIVERNVSEIKEFCREQEDLDLKKILNREKENKNRSSLREWLENRINQEAEDDV